jgi:hypothetical protein
MIKLEIDGLKLSKNLLEGNDFSNYRTDNQIKNHFHSKLRKGIRKLNKCIKL